MPPLLQAGIWPLVQNAVLLLPAFYCLVRGHRHHDHRVGVDWTLLGLSLTVVNAIVTLAP